MLTRFLHSLHVPPSDDGADLPGIKVTKLEDGDLNLPFMGVDVFTFTYNEVA